jgi:hypothetical protein
VVSRPRPWRRPALRPRPDARPASKPGATWTTANARLDLGASCHVLRRRRWPRHAGRGRSRGVPSPCRRWVAVAQTRDRRCPRLEIEKLVIGLEIRREFRNWPPPRSLGGSTETLKVRPRLGGLTPDTGRRGPPAVVDIRSYSTKVRMGSLKTMGA